MMVIATIMAIVVVALYMKNSATTKNVASETKVEQKIEQQPKPFVEEPGPKIG